MTDEWREASEYSKIPRISWKGILGMSLTSYLRDNAEKSDEDLTFEILKKVKEVFEVLKEQGWTMPKIANNLKISLSARRTEQRMYGAEDGRTS